MLRSRLRQVPWGFLAAGVAVAIIVWAVIASTPPGSEGLANETNRATASVSPTTLATTAPPGPAQPTGTVDWTQAPDGAEELQARFAAGEAISIVVLGDQTGTDESDWVGAWTRDLAMVRPIELLVPSADDPTAYVEPVRFGAGEGLLTIRNASIIGATPGYAARAISSYVPAETDLVLINFGRSNTAADIELELDELQQAVGHQAPGAHLRVLIQPPRQDGQPDLDDLVRRWAQRAGVSVVDVAAEFDRQGLTTTVVSERDPLSVNLRGSQEWARIVQDAVFGPLDLPAPAPQTGTGTVREPTPTRTGPPPSYPQEPLPTVTYTRPGPLPTRTTTPPRTT
ncbi:MAG: SGNH/GDSL hydrolase family protein, partial [Actinomycetia bacterium]|nr:SGNH/GDSL hydrolase family protein [Actinomycetes bacterium]